MNRYLPMIVIWMTVLVAMLELLSQLQLILTDLKYILAGFVVVGFLSTVFLGWKKFKDDSEKILNGIFNWDEEMKNEVPSFLSVRKVRLISSWSIVGFLLLAKLLLPFFSTQKQMHEGVQYIFLIGLFHVSLVTSLILFKMNRTIAWVKHENYLSTLETE